jgi:hypothetical protein
MILKEKDGPAPPSSSKDKPVVPTAVAVYAAVIIPFATVGDDAACITPSVDSTGI